MDQYLIRYGADNELWFVRADSVEHAIEQLRDAEPDAEINEIMICQPVPLPEGV